MVAYIKLRKRGEKAWWFLSSGSALNRLRIHAARFDSAEKAQALIDANAADNPEWEWKVVPA